MNMDVYRSNSGTANSGALLSIVLSITMQQPSRMMARRKTMQSQTVTGTESKKTAVEIEEAKEREADGMSNTSDDAAISQPSTCVGESRRYARTPLTCSAMTKIGSSSTRSCSREEKGRDQTATAEPLQTKTGPRSHSSPRPVSPFRQWPMHRSTPPTRPPSSPGSALYP